VEVVEVVEVVAAVVNDGTRRRGTGGGPGQRGPEELRDA
jgi:hypothetical protein